MGLVKLLLSIAGILILAILGLAGYLWITDHQVEATITEKEGNVITIRPKIVPRDFQYTLDSQSAQFVCEGYQVKYALRSGHYIVYDREGDVVYDSHDASPDFTSAIQCSRLPVLG